MQIKITSGAWLAAAGLLMVGLAGCRVHNYSEEKKVQIDTPFGGLHVNTDQTTATDLGLPVYPGAQPVKDDNNSSADVHMGFGEWQLRVRVVNYQTPDAQKQVSDFYRKALGRYGEVLICQNDQPVGQPTTTSQGLTCSDDSKHLKVNVHGGKDGIEMGDLQLKAGSKRHQHIVGFEKPKSGQTKFVLLALDLPTDSGDKDKRD